MAAPELLTALVGAVIGYYFGHWLGNFMAASTSRWARSDDNDMAIVLGYAFLIIGWLIGLGVFNDLVRRMLGQPIPQLERSAKPAAASAGTSGSRSTTRSWACST